jgi:hypothetical protein
MLLGLQCFSIQCALSRIWCLKLIGVKDSKCLGFVCLSCIGPVLELQDGMKFFHPRAFMEELCIGIPHTDARARIFL